MTSRPPLRLLIDMDSIIVDLNSRWYPEINRRFGDNLTNENVTSWNIPDLSKGGQGVYDILREPGFYAGLQPLPGAIEAMRELLADPRYTVYVLSYAPNGQAFKDKSDWLRQWLPELNHQRVIFCYSKFLVDGDVLFDDAPHNLEEWQSAHPWGKTATIRYPYNSAYVEDRQCWWAAHRSYVAGDWQDPAGAWRRFVNWLDGFTYNH